MTFQTSSASSADGAIKFVLRAPLRGWATPLDEVPDPVFSGRILGDGIAIDPFDSTLRAPCDGTVTMVHRAGHAVTLRTADGLEILMHIGLETVALRGEGFTPHVVEGQTVAAGDPLISFDLAVVAERAPCTLIPVIITNTDAFSIVGKIEGQEVNAGDSIFDVVSLGGSAAAGAPATAAPVERDVVVTAPHGIHARPAGLIARRAADFTAEITLGAKGRSASARSAVSLMGLGVQHGDIVSIIAAGADAQHAVKALAELLTSSLGDEAESASATCVAAAPSAPGGASQPPFVSGQEAVLSGVTAAPGRAVGHAVRLTLPTFHVSETGGDAATELSRLRDAVGAAAAGLRDGLAADAATSASARAILSAHLAFLEDPALLTRSAALIRAGKSAGFAWQAAIDEQVAVLRSLGDARLAERSTDLRDVARRVLAALAGDRETFAALSPDAVLFADDLLPSQLAGLSAGAISGICTAAGGPTSHVAILAGSLGIPALVAAGPDVLRVPEGAPVILDANAGVARVFPPASALEQMRVTITTHQARSAAHHRDAREDCYTADGVRIQVVANLGNAAEVPPAIESGAEGCGLLRSEFLFLNRDSAPSEDEQVAQYQAVATALAGRPLIIRTLDAGADKDLPYLGMPKEENPQLGVRGIRLGLARPELLRAQFRAILRVRPAGQCMIMLPMVASLAELQAARRLLDEERVALGHDGAVKLGIMIEVPAAALLSDALAAEADFFSIGTNDLTQYVLAVDRLNPALAKQVDALHPAVLRLIAAAVDGARKHGRWVGVCGSLASVPLAAPVLVGLGVTELSTPAAAVPAVKAMVRGLTMSACLEAAAEALRQNSPQAVRSALAQRWPDVC